MRHMKTGRKLSRRREHRMAMLANLAASIIKHEQVRTTDAKAKEVRPFIERLVTFARRGDLHARRIVLSRLKGDTEAVRKLFDEIGPRYTSRPGGYTRILKLGFRQGDNSPISLIEFVGEETDKKATRKSKPKKARSATPKSVEKAPETVDAEATSEAQETVEAEIVAEADEATADVAEESVEAAPVPEAEVKEAPAEETVAEKAETASESTEKAEAEPEEAVSADTAEEEKKDDK